MRDGKARFARHIDINIDICSRVENRSDPFVIVTEKVGKLRDAFSLNGFKNERHRVQLNEGLEKFNKIATSLPGSTGGQPVLFGSLPKKLFERSPPKIIATLSCRRQAADDCRLAACAPQTHQRTSTSIGRR
jgi:hypothetical protein